MYWQNIRICVDICITNLHVKVYAASPNLCCISMVHAACPCLCSLSLFMPQVLYYIIPLYTSMSISMLNAHVLAVCHIRAACPIIMSLLSVISIPHLHVQAAWPCQCCCSGPCLISVSMSMSILHVLLPKLPIRVYVDVMVHVPAACSRSQFIFIVHAAFPCLWCCCCHSACPCWVDMNMDMGTDMDTETNMDMYAGDGHVHTSGYLRVSRD